MAAGAVGAFMGAPDAVDAGAPGLLDVLGRRRIEPVLDRVTGGCWIATRVVPPLWVTFGRSTMTSTRSRWLWWLWWLWSSNILPWPVGEGNWVSLKSVEAVSKLLCRSSKLTEGRKSNEAVVSPRSSAGSFLLPNENSEWLLAEEALSIGASREGRPEVTFGVGLGFSLRLRLGARCQHYTQHDDASEDMEEDHGIFRSKKMGQKWSDVPTSSESGSPVVGQRVSYDPSSCVVCLARERA